MFRNANTCDRELTSSSVRRQVRTRFKPIRDWMTVGLVRAVRTRKKLFRIFRTTGSAWARIRHESYNSRLRRLMRQAKISCYRRRLEESRCDPKAAWRIIKTCFRGRPRAGTLVPELVGLNVEDVNRFFANLGLNTVLEAGLSPGLTEDLPSQNPIFFNEFIPPTASEISTILANLVTSKAPGIDGIPRILALWRTTDQEAVRKPGTNEKGLPSNPSRAVPTQPRIPSVTEFRGGCHEQTFGFRIGESSTR